MIRECAGLPFLDERTRWEIDDAIETRDKTLPCLRQGLATHALRKAQSASDVEFSWYQLAPRIKAGHVGFEARRLVVEMLRPRLKLEWPEEAEGPGEISSCVLTSDPPNIHRRKKS
jgi:hypothetical protein